MLQPGHCRRQVWDFFFHLSEPWLPLRHTRIAGGGSDCHAADASWHAPGQALLRLHSNPQTGRAFTGEPSRHKTPRNFQLELAAGVANCKLVTARLTSIPVFFFFFKQDTVYLCVNWVSVCAHVTLRFVCVNWVNWFLCMLVGFCALVYVPACT